MAVKVIPHRNGLIENLMAGPIVGIDTKSAVNAGDTSTALADKRYENLQNMRLVNGQPVRMDGSTLYATSFVAPDNDIPIAAYPYTNSDGTQVWVVVTEAGIGYTVAVSGGIATFTQRRAGLSSAEVFMSGVQLGDYRILCDRTNGHWKWDGSNFILLGGRMISDMETDETWTGGTANTTAGQFREGLQSQSRESTGTAVTLVRTLSSVDFTDGLLLAKVYPTTGALVARIHFWFYIATAADVDLTTTYVRFGDAGDANYFQAVASVANWGTLANGLNEIQIPLTSFASTGAPVWTDIDKITFAFDTTGATMTFSVDDLYIRYAASDTMPAAAVNAEFKGVYFSGDAVTNGRSAIQFARTGAPDEYTSTAFNQIKETDGSNVSGMHPFYNQLFVTKDNSCHSLSVSLTGTVYPNYNFDLQQITIRHGCTSHRSLIEDGNRKLWMHWRGEFHRYDGQKTEYMSNDIEPTLADLNFGRLTQVVGGYFNTVNEIWWSFPAAADTTANTVLVRYSEDTEGGWLNSAAQAFRWMVPTFVGGEEQFLTVGTTGRFLEQNSGTTFDSTAIVCVVRPGWMACELYMSVKAWLDAIVNFAREVSGGGTVTLQYRIADHPIQMNAASFATLATFDNSQTDGESFGRAFIGDRAKWLQLQLTTSGVPLSVLWPWVVTARDLTMVY